MLPKARFLSSLLLLTTSSFAFGWQQTQPLQHLFEVDPPLGDIWVTEQPTRTIRFDVERLKSPFVKERLEIAQKICLEHANPTFKQQERTMELLLGKLKEGETNLQVRRAMFSAALVVGDATHAESLWSLAKSDTKILSAVERRLVQWKSSLALKDWRERLADPSAKPTELATALQGLAIVGNGDDRAALVETMRASYTTSANKHLAAVALGSHVNEGLNEFAQQVMDSDLDQRHLLAAHILKRHSGSITETQLRRILADGPVTAKLVAYRTISESMPKVARELAKQMTSQPDNGLRIMALRVLHKESDDDSLRIQGALLNDRHPEVRNLAGTNVLEKSAQGQRAVVDELVLAHLNSEQWTGIEKAIILAVRLQDRSHCKAFLRLLDHRRPEVNMLAGWALMELGNDAEILAGMLAHAEKLTGELGSTQYVLNDLTPTDQVRLSFLHEGFGRNQYQPANGMLLKFIAKKGHYFGIVSRASAIWALGKLNQGKDNQALRSSLYKRMSDFELNWPEDHLVRFSCNLALGEMAHSESRATIERYGEELPSPIAHAAAWALSQIDKASGSKPAE